MMVLIFVSHLYGVDYLPLINQHIIWEKLQNKMKSGKKCLQENAEERQYS